MLLPEGAGQALCPPLQPNSPTLGQGKPSPATTPLPGPARSKEYVPKNWGAKISQGIKPRAQDNSHRGLKAKEALWIRTSFCYKVLFWQVPVEATFPGGPGDLLPSDTGSPKHGTAILQFWRGWSLPTDQTCSSEQAGEGTLYTLNTFHTQIRPEIQISSFKFNQPLPEMQPEVSVPRYFQVTANRPIWTLLQQKSLTFLHLLQGTINLFRDKRFNSQCTAHLNKEPKVRHTTTFPWHARHYFSTKQAFVLC